jgi:hypothetical protein
LGGTAFAVSDGEGICTGDVRRFVRQRFAQLAIKQAQLVVEQGAVFRVIDSVDTRTLSTWMADKHLLIQFEAARSAHPIPPIIISSLRL